MREAASSLDATIKTLQCSMQASFVALPGKKSPQGRPMRYLCLAQCDNEEVVRDALAVGESGELLFDPPKENKVSAGWKYTIRPPIPHYEYTGNIVFQVRRPEMTSVISLQAASQSRICTRSKFGPILKHRMSRHGD